MNTSKPTLSIIICTYNRALFLDKCLEALHDQNMPEGEYEIIVVDNNSSDSTRSVVEDHLARVNNLRFVFEIRQGLSNARNLGLHEARGEFLLYLDDDALVPPTYLTKLLGVIRTYSPDFIGGPVIPYYTTDKPWWFRDAFETRKYEEKSGFSRTCLVSGVNYALRKAVLEKLGGFNPGYGMSGQRLGMLEERMVLELYRSVTPPDQQKVYYALECEVKHHIASYKLSLRYMLKRSFVAGRAAFWMVLEVSGKADHLIGIKTVLIALPVMVRDAFHQIRMQGLVKTDYVKHLIGGLSTFSRGCGILLSQFSYLFGARKSANEKT